MISASPTSVWVAQGPWGPVRLPEASCPSGRGNKPYGLFLLQQVDLWWRKADAHGQDHGRPRTPEPVCALILFWSPYYPQEYRRPVFSPVVGQKHPEVRQPPPVSPQAGAPAWAGEGGHGPHSQCHSAWSGWDSDGLESGHRVPLTGTVALRELWLSQGESGSGHPEPCHGTHSLFGPVNVGVCFPPGGGGPPAAEANRLLATDGGEPPVAEATRLLATDGREPPVAETARLSTTDGGGPPAAEVARLVATGVWLVWGPAGGPERPRGLCPPGGRVFFFLERPDLDLFDLVFWPLFVPGLVPAAGPGLEVAEVPGCEVTTGAGAGALSTVA